MAGRGDRHRLHPRAALAAPHGVDAPNLGRGRRFAGESLRLDPPTSGLWWPPLAALLPLQPCGRLIDTHLPYMATTLAVVSELTNHLPAAPNGSLRAFAAHRSLRHM